MESVVGASVAAFGLAYYARPGAGLVALAWVLAYLALSTFVPFVRNIFVARRSGFPSVWILWNPHSFLWMVLQHPLRPILQRHLPAAVWKRLCLTVYGWEFHERFKPYQDLAGSEDDAKSFMLVSCGGPEVFTWDSEIISQVLSRPRDFQVQDFTAVIVDKFGKSLFTAEGDVWARQRKIIASVINEKISRAVFNESIRQTEGLLDEVFGAAEGQLADTNRLFDMMKKITIHVLSGAGMGTSVPWNDAQGEQIKPGFKMNYMTACKTVTGAVAGPILLPQWFLRNYPSSWPGAAFLHDLGHAMREYPLLTRDKLDQERARSAMAKKDGGAGNEAEAKNNIMSQLLRANQTGPDSKGVSLSETEMMGNLFIFTVAGFDTTANTLSYALMLLARHPHWQDWLLEEVDALLPPTISTTSDPSSPPPASGSSSAQLEYTDIHPKATRTLAFMYETLRHFPALIHIVKQCHGEQLITTSRGTTYRLPHMATLYLNSVCTHLDPSVYRNLNLAPTDTPSSSDELLFRPTRWINSSSTAGGSSSQLFVPPKGAYVPWSMGPRHCPGMKMAQVEFTAVMLALLRRHRVEATPVEAGESRGAIEARLDAQMRRSISKLTSEMEGVYDVTGKEQGFSLRLRRRR